MRKLLEMNMQTADAAYFAGFIDADGTITVDRQKRYAKRFLRSYYYTPRIKICNRDKSVLDFFNDLTLGTASYTKRRWPKNKKNIWCEVWVMSWTSQPIRAFLPTILPYLRTKKKQALLVLEMLAMKKDTSKLSKEHVQQQFKLISEDYSKKLSRYDEIFRLVRSYNARGPEYLVNNGVNSGNPKSNMDMAILSQAGGTPSEGAETTGEV